MATPGYTSVEIPQMGMIFEIRGKDYEAGQSTVKVTKSGIKVFTDFHPVDDEGNLSGEATITVDLDTADMKLI